MKKIVLSFDKENIIDITNVNTNRYMIFCKFEDMEIGIVVENKLLNGNIEYKVAVNSALSPKSLDGKMFFESMYELIEFYNVRGYEFYIGE